MAKSKRRKKRHSAAESGKNGVGTQERAIPATSDSPLSKKRVSRRQQRLEAQARAVRMKRIRIGGLVVIVLALIAGVIFWRNAGVIPVEELSVSANLDGPADAPVRIVEFGDFGCPSCRAWHNAGIREQIRAEFGDQVTFEFRHFPVITAQSPQAAEAAQCASEQDAFWDYHDYIYEQSPQGALAVADLKGYAQALELDEQPFNNCLDSGKYRDYVTKDMQDAFAAGARGTPSFFIDGQPISFSYAGMATAVQQALNN